MAKGDFYFPFYYQRFFSSTQGWTEEQEGSYIRLLSYQFDKGSIPNDPKVLKKIAPKSIKNWSLFESKFVQNSEGNLINPVMDEIRQRIQAKKDKNLKNGKLGGRPKTERLEITKPNGSENKTERLTERVTQTKPIPISNIQTISTNVDIEPPTAKPIGSEKVGLIANEAWSDQAWREQLCMGLNIKTEEQLKRWMAQFNSSIANDFVSGFNAQAYKKMVRGWIQKQISKGTTVDAPEPTTSNNHRLKKIS